MLDLNDTQRRADAHVQDRRRQRPAAARPEGPARDAAARRRQRGRATGPSTATSRPRASAPSSAGCSRLEQQGGDKFFGEPMLDIDDLMQTDADGRGVVNILAADKLHAVAAALRDASCCGCCPSCSSGCPRSATPRSRSSSSSSTRRTCSSTTRRRRCSRRSSRWCGSFARRASASTSSRRTRSTFPTRCSASSAIACSTRCAPSRRAIRRR